MSKVAIYLNFQGNAEKAFTFYKSVFKTDFSMPIMRVKDLPPDPNTPKFSESELNYVMHVALPIIGGTELMGTDMLESMGHQLVIGNNTTISLQLDSKEEADQLYKALSENGSDKQNMRDEFWGYWGCCLDQFGIRWMFNVMND
ncbi:VOC family protein [Flavobacterium jejuense]|uniref:VOC family protein n=1 Tax=Flavobacterium jejuense TaxID=1544455 RepID=A0ABX0ITU4_9FLAO|nr:VOC family protein [Flavobacterium jejuense]NHN25948.1 VOC family protein [Flavobacterium jejuense]